jgi:hypothetical protein
MMAEGMKRADADEQGYVRGTPEFEYLDPGVAWEWPFESATPHADIERIDADGRWQTEERKEQEHHGFLR